MPTLDVTHVDGDRFGIRVRGHEIFCDQPYEDGGADTAPTPTELFVASLAACVGFYARRYLRRHGLPEDPLDVRAEWAMSASPARVGEITIDLVVPAEVPQERRAGLLAVAGHCTIHNSLADPPDVTIRLVDTAASAA